MKKEGFVIYKRFYEPLSSLSDEELGKLLRIIFRYQMGEEIDIKEGNIKMAFMFIKTYFDVDNEKWERIVAIRSECGKLGGRPRKATTKANASDEKQKKQMFFLESKKSYKEKEKEKEKDKGKEKNIEKESAYADKKKTENPSDSDLDERRLKFQEFMRQFPTVQKMKQPLTMEQYIGAVKKYGRQRVDAMLAQMENRNNPPVNKAYQSANLTLQKWLGREYPTGGQSSGNPAPGVKLGYGERIENGRRTFGDGTADIPPDAPPRPGDYYFWGEKDGIKQWIYIAD